MTTQTTITRDELAAKLRMNTEALRKREAALGIKQHKLPTNTRPPQYKLKPVMQILRALGFVE